MASSIETQESSEESTSSIPPSERQPMWRNRWLWAILAAMTAITVGAFYLPSTSPGFATGISRPSAAPSSSAGSQTHPVAAAPLAPARTPEEVSTSIRLPRRVAAALRKWNAGHGGGTLDAVTNDLGSALQAGGLKLYSPMSSACISLATAVSTAKAGPPIPNAASENSYVAALTALAKAAADCRAAISEKANGDESVLTEENPNLLQQARLELGAGSSGLYLVTEEIAAAVRR
jgi:hypothetical protein